MGRQRSAGGAARAALLGIAISWGLNWPAVKLALLEMPLWSMRAFGMSFGTALLFLLARASGRSLAVPRHERSALLLAGLLNVAGFNLLSALAQTLMPTSRAAALAYTMPLWAALLAVPVLGERLDRRRRIALALGGAGLIAVVAPLLPAMAEPGMAVGTLAILGASLCWAAGTVWTKRTAFTADPLATTGWQLAIGAVAALIGFFVFDAPYLSGHALLPVTAFGWAGLIYNGVVGVALSYFLWFGVVTRLPASTAAIGTLLVPVVGILGAMALIGDRPSLSDALGFALIGAAVLINLRSGR